MLLENLCFQCSAIWGPEDHKGPILVFSLFPCRQGSVHIIWIILTVCIRRYYFRLLHFWQHNRSCCDEPSHLFFRKTMLFLYPLVSLSSYQSPSLIIRCSIRCFLSAFPFYFFLLFLLPPSNCLWEQALWYAAAILTLDLQVTAAFIVSLAIQQGPLEVLGIMSTWGDAIICNPAQSGKVTDPATCLTCVGIHTVAAMKSHHWNSTCTHKTFWNI